MTMMATAAQIARQPGAPPPAAVAAGSAANKRATRSDVTAGYTLGAPFWQPLPDTQKGGAWLVPLTGPSGVTVTTPVAPGVPRVRKGLPEGAVLQLTAQEERDIIIESKCVSRGRLQPRHTLPRPPRCMRAFACATQS